MHVWSLAWDSPDDDFGDTQTRRRIRTTLWLGPPDPPPSPPAPSWVREGRASHGGGVRGTGGRATYGFWMPRSAIFPFSSRLSTRRQNDTKRSLASHGTSQQPGEVGLSPILFFLLFILFCVSVFFYSYRVVCTWYYYDVCVVWVCVILIIVLLLLLPLRWVLVIKMCLIYCVFNNKL